MNPLLPRRFFIPDAEARVMPDGRLYLYGSQDISGAKDYCSEKYRVFSTDDPKMENWTDHGVSVCNYGQDSVAPFPRGVKLYAPDCIYFKGKYYLYLCGSDRSESVMESDKPEGPFTNARPVIGADKDGIDPAVFVDDDGQAYYFWGQFRLKGARLCEDMATLEKDSIKDSILTEMEHGFHEGASIRKRCGRYYLLYTDVSGGRATRLSYAVADHPLGPYKKGGTVIDNIYCDPDTWNNHGSIECFKGQWYVFYHRSSQNSKTSRRVCAEPIYFNEDGTIKPADMSTQGASAPVSALRRIDAASACRVKGNVYICPESAETDDNTEVNEILKNAGGGNWIEDWAEYKYIDFSSDVELFAVRAKGQGSISVMVEDFGIICSVEINSEDFSIISAKLSESVNGVKAVWLLIRGQGISIDRFSFE